MTTHRCSDQMPMTSESADIRARFTYSVRGVPKRPLRAGAPNTANSATRMPQAQNTPPSLSGDRCIRNGA